jgi:hypothetical protein
VSANRPRLSSGPLILASSPYARTAVLWETYCKQYGPTGDALTLVAHGASNVFNPTLPQRVIDAP